MLIARWMPGRRRGLAYGIGNDIGTVAAALGVLLVSRLYSETRGFRLLFVVLAALVAAIFAAAVLLPAESSEPAKSGV